MTSYQDIDIIHLTGKQCFEFINNQTLSLVTATSDQQCQFSAICSPKGRILYTLFIITDNDEMWLACDNSVSESLLQYLNMRRFRMDVNVQLTKEWSLSSEQAPKQLKDNRYSLTLSQEKATDSLWPHLFEWGLPWITIDYQDEHIPQHVNLDQAGVIDFKKGCFPGQEIVARLHYLGKIKKRMQLFEVNTNDHDSPVDQSIISPDWCSDPIELNGQTFRQGVIKVERS